MRVGDQRHPPTAYPQEYPATHRRGGWVGPSANIMVYENDLSRLGQVKLPYFTPIAELGKDTWFTPNTNKNVI
jgi:hypothetical protein